MKPNMKKRCASLPSAIVCLFVCFGRGLDCATCQHVILDLFYIHAYSVFSHIIKSVFFYTDFFVLIVLS